jgi:hypothetical protein
LVNGEAGYNLGVDAVEKVGNSADKGHIINIADNAYRFCKLTGRSLGFISLPYIRENSTLIRADLADVRR